MIRRRRVAAAVVLLAVVAVAAAAWMLGARVRSPAQAAARAAAPEPSLVTFAVERRVLSATLIVRADIVSATAVPVAGPAAGEAGAAVVTGVFVARGDSVSDGDRIVEVAGRPVFVFAGSTPAYRAVGPAMVGADVVQLQAGLVGLGCAAGNSGTYDEPTKQCFEELYRNAGYATTRSTPTETADLTAAEDAVVDAQDALEATRVTLWEAAQPASETALAGARAALATTHQARAAAAADRPTLIDQATRQVDTNVADTADALDAARAAATPDDPASQAAIATAERAHAAAVADRPIAIGQATRQADMAVAAAEAGVTSAESALAELAAAPDTALQQLAVEQQERAVERAQQRLAELTAASGPVVPFGEVVFVPELPARVDAVGAVVGAPTSGDPMAGGAGSLAVLAAPLLEARIALPQADAGLVQPGTPVELLYEATGDTLPGTVRTIGQELEPAVAGGLPAYPVVVDAALPESWSGLNVRATFTAATTESEVLVVPLAAVSSDAGGRTRVQVEREPGVVDIVEVTAGLSADGFVEVAPAEGGPLVAGDRVVIGR